MGLSVINHERRRLRVYPDNQELGRNCLVFGHSEGYPDRLLHELGHGRFVRRRPSYQ